MTTPVERLYATHHDCMEDGNRERLRIYLDHLEAHKTSIEALYPNQSSTIHEQLKQSYLDAVNRLIEDIQQQLLTLHNPKNITK